MEEGRFGAQNRLEKRNHRRQNRLAIENIEAEWIEQRTSSVRNGLEDWEVGSIMG